MSRQKQQTQRIEDDILTQSLPLPVQIDEVAKIRGWFRPPNDSLYYPLIQSYLDGKTSLQDTLQELTAPLDKARQRDKMYDAWGDVWYSFIHSAKRIPVHDEQNFDKLLSLLKALSEDPQYKQFPKLGMYSREAYNDSPGVGAGWTPPENSAWASYNSFLARLDQEGLFESASSFGLWALRDALERNWADSSEDDVNPGTKTQKYDATTPAAAAWVTTTGKKLYGQEEDVDPKLKKKDVALRDLDEGGKMWPGAARFSKERWTFWKARFGEIAGMEEIGEATRKVAREAAEAMEKVESN